MLLKDAEEYLKKNSSIIYCLEHSNECYRYFDEDCQKLICSDCTAFGNHRGYKDIFF